MAWAMAGSDNPDDTAAEQALVAQVPDARIDEALRLTSSQRRHGIFFTLGD